MKNGDAARALSPFPAILRRPTEPAYHVFTGWPTPEYVDSAVGSSLCGTVWDGHTERGPHSYGSLSAHQRIRAFVCHACDAAAAARLSAGLSYESIDPRDLPTLPPDADAIGHAEPPRPTPAYEPEPAIEPTPDEIVDGIELVYGSRFGQHVAFIPRADVIAAEQRFAAVEEAVTWRDLRARPSADDLLQIDSGEPDDELIPSETVHDRLSRWLSMDMTAWMPKAIAIRYGELLLTRLDGEFLVIAHEHTEAVVETLERFGYRCVVDDDAIQRFSHL